jgi:hypothetical protein
MILIYDTSVDVKNLCSVESSAHCLKDTNSFEGPEGGSYPISKSKF